MLRFRQMKSLQKFAAVHSAVHNHFNKERHLSTLCNFKHNRAPLSPSGANSAPPEIPFSLGD